MGHLRTTLSTTALYAAAPLTLAFCAEGYEVRRPAPDPHEIAAQPLVAVFHHSFETEPQLAPDRMPTAAGWLGGLRGYDDGGYMHVRAQQDRAVQAWAEREVGINRAAQFQLQVAAAL